MLFSWLDGVWIIGESEVSMLLIWLITGDVNLDHSVGLLSAGFLHCLVTVFPFVIDRYLGRGALRPHEFLLKLAPLILPLVGWILHASYYCGISQWWLFLNVLHSFYIYELSSWLVLWGRPVPSPSFISVINIYLYGLMKWGESCSVVSDSLQPHGLYIPGNSPGQNTWVGSLSLLQGIFLSQGSNPGLLHCGQILYQLSHRKALVYWSG